MSYPDKKFPNGLKVDAKRGGTPGHHDTGMDTLETEDLMTSHVRWRQIYVDVSVRQQTCTFSPPIGLGIRNDTRGPRLARMGLEVLVRTGTSIRTCITLPARENVPVKTETCRTSYPERLIRPWLDNVENFEKTNPNEIELLREYIHWHVIGDVTMIDDNIERLTIHCTNKHPGSRFNID